MKKKKYVQPECDIVYSYDLETELMYGNTLDGGGRAFSPITGSGGNISTTPNLLSTDDIDDSDRAKGNNHWGNIWED